MEFPFPEPENQNQRLTRQVFWLATAALRSPEEDRGYLLLMLNARRLRNLLSRHNAFDSEARGFPRTPGVRFFYFFDAEGWVLFESEPPEMFSAELATHQVRAGFSGTLGRKGQPFAFRPDSTVATYWTMVEDVMRGKHGVIGLPPPPSGSFGGSHFLAYAPVRFRSSPAAEPQPIAGLAFQDVSRLSAAAGYRHIDLMLTITAASALFVGALIYWIGRILTRPILRLADAVSKLDDELRPVRLPYRGREIAILQEAINRLIADLQRHLEELRRKDRALRDAGLKREARLEFPPTDAASDPVAAIVGRGARVERLKAEIVKASQVDYDVLILGETGSGKQLAAEAIHRLSARAAGPFVSINCGALDENLLLDTLFGHVRGAFTEAKADRKGAFLEADGGTLFLDEVQVASPRVQQALLRALAERKIKPLGSDRETAVDVRLVAASNADLEALIRRGEFREDLYFRLKVITLHTVPLREQRENIPLLVRHFLDREEKRTGRTGLGLSRGALAKLKRHDWPGNVRELQNCLMRAVVMAEGPLIQAEDIPLAVPGWEEDPGESAAEEERREEAPSPAAEGLNARQMRAWPVILAEGRITRSRYQEIVGDLPVRTAIYDLQDLVARGLLRKAGKGPATHYLPVPPRRR
ncbi:MAG: sigma 54-interacting transcriptional regulator [Desulfobacterales bacterium]